MARIITLGNPLAIWKLQYRCADLGLVAVSPLLVALRPALDLLIGVPYGFGQIILPP
jgi:hypothetical protein